MIAKALAAAERFERDDKGTVAVIFGLCAVVLFTFAGIGIDIGRVIHTRTRIADAMDAAALAAVKGIRLENLTDTEATTLAQTVFNDNMQASSGRWGTVNSFNVTLDRANSSAQIDVTASVPTTLTAVAGIPSMSIAKTTTAVFDIKNIEVGVQLDLTGSMCSPCSKIAALRTATDDLLDILLPDAGTPNTIRVALAPFAQSVNAGALAGPVTNYRSTDGCVYESSAHDPNTDAAPSASTGWLKVAGDAGVTGTPHLCPGGPKVVPLTSDKSMLKAQVATYGTYNSTAGHLGTAWAWYMISPNWSSFLPSASQPAAYNDQGTTKVAILMTDGVYNTVGGTDLGDVSATASDSQTRAVTMCNNMKAQGIRVYTVGFDLSQIASATARANADTMLRACASAPAMYYQANTGAELSAAFHTIANQIMTLRLSK